jgi:hypothetical protein
MLNEDALLLKVRKLVESKVGWGSSDEWTNQDFISLSEKIFQQTNVSLSHVTLKRLWGKVKYDSLPNTHTLNTLAKFVGFENWRDFKSKDTNEVLAQPIELPQSTPTLSTSRGNNKLKTLVFLAILVALGCCFLFFYSKSPLYSDDYSFSSTKVISEGVPNSVIFDYDATRAPEDSVIIQQSWDKKLQTKVPKNKHQHTSIYYYPDFYRAKLIVAGEIVKEHSLLIKTDGWLTVVATSPVPVYFKKEDAIADGKIHLPIDKIQSQNISLQPISPVVVYSNVHDYGELYSSDFIFETLLKNDYSEGASVCQKTNIYLLCEGTAIGIPLCAKGCVSDADLLFTKHFYSGKQKDLSAFGVDFSDFIKVRIETKNDHAKIFVNDTLSYEVDDIVKAKIIGIDYTFQGTGTVEYVKLWNDNLLFDEQF